MTNGQIKTLNVLDICGDILAGIEILISIIILNFSTNEDINYIFMFISIICGAIILKSIFNIKRTQN